MPNIIHICGQCGRKFETETAYLQHKCSATPASTKEVKQHTKLFEADILAAVKSVRKIKKGL